MDSNATNTKRRKKKAATKRGLSAGGRTKFCPSEIAQMWGVGRERILVLIRRGDLPATNVALNPAGRPRFLVSVEDIREFDLRRRVITPPPVHRRRRSRTADVSQYFLPVGTRNKSLKF